MIIVFCLSCLEKAVDKLISDDIAILEYLKDENANIPQCAISRKVIKTDLDMPDYKCYTAMSKLENFNMIERQIGSRASKYFITKSGFEILRILEKKLQGVE